MRAILLVFDAAPDNPLLGPWVVDSYATAPGAVTAPLEGTELTAVFRLREGRRLVRAATRTRARTRRTARSPRSARWPRPGWPARRTSWRRRPRSWLRSRASAASSRGAARSCSRTSTGRTVGRPVPAALRSLAEPERRAVRQRRPSRSPSRAPTPSAAPSATPHGPAPPRRRPRRRPRHGLPAPAARRHRPSNRRPRCHRPRPALFDRRRDHATIVYPADWNTVTAPPASPVGTSIPNRSPCRPIPSTLTTAVMIKADPAATYAGRARRSHEPDGLERPHQRTGDRRRAAGDPDRGDVDGRQPRLSGRRDPLRLSHRRRRTRHLDRDVRDRRRCDLHRRTSRSST